MHFSALSLVEESVKKPLLYYDNNVARGIQLVRTMLDNGVHNIIFSSTAAVYGIPENVPITETEPTEPINPYGRSKLQFEEFLADCAQSEGLCYSALRYFNASGASEDYGEDHRPETHLIPLVLQVALDKRGSLVVYGDDYDTHDGSCIRDYIHVLDLAEAHLLAMAELRKGKKAASVYNIGNNNGFSVLEIIEVAEQITGNRIPFTIGKRRPGDPPILIAASNKIRKELSWEPRFREVGDIIESAWKWHKKHPGGYIG
jgi:UDP-glucose 4-epimerase